MDSTYGAMYIGLLFATFFQGVLTVQAYNYYDKYPEDSMHNKFLVGCVWIVDLIHLILISKTGYHYFISSWGNDQALLYSTRELNFHLVLIGVSTILCQAFFLRRIWVFSNRNIPLLLSLIIGCLATLILNVAIAIVINFDLQIASFTKHTPEVIAVYSIGAGTDIVMALLMCVYLRRSRIGHGRTDTTLGHIMQLVIATGLATSLLAAGCLIAYLLKPTSFIFFALHFSLGRMYTISLLTTLNGRKALRNNLQLTAPAESELVIGPRRGVHNIQEGFFTEGEVPWSFVNHKDVCISLSTHGGNNSTRWTLVSPARQVSP